MTTDKKNEEKKSPSFEHRIVGPEAHAALEAALGADREDGLGEKEGDSEKEILAKLDEIIALLRAMATKNKSGVLKG